MTAAADYTQWPEYQETLKIDAVTPALPPTEAPCDLIQVAIPNIANFLGNQFTPEALKTLNRIIAPPKKKRGKHTAGFEIELFAGENNAIGCQGREIHIGPFTDLNEAMERLQLATRLTLLDQKDPISTLHINSGGESEIPGEYLSDFHYVMDSLATFCNSPTRQEGQPHVIKWKGQKRILPFGKQTGRYEFKGFDIGAGADLPLTRLAIKACWAMQDNPSLAKDLRRGFEQIWRGLGISISLSSAPTFLDGEPVNINRIKTRIPEDFYGHVVKKPEPGMWGCPTSANVLGCIADQRPLVREMVAQILTDGGLKLSEDFLPENPDEIYSLRNVRQFEAGLSLKERAAEHPFAAKAAACPEPEEPGAQKNATIIPIYGVGSGLTRGAGIDLAAARCELGNLSSRVNPRDLVITSTRHPASPHNGSEYFTSGGDTENYRSLDYNSLSLRIMHGIINEGGESAQRISDTLLFMGLQSSESNRAEHVIQGRDADPHRTPTELSQLRDYIRRRTLRPRGPEPSL